MYSFQPLIDNGSYVVEVIFILLLTFVIFCIIAVNIEEKIVSKLGSTLLGVIGILLVLISAFLVYNAVNRPAKIFKNEQVIGEYVSFNPETVVSPLGKGGFSFSYNQMDTVTYKVPDGYVHLPANRNVIYPDKVILYKN